MRQQIYHNQYATLSPSEFNRRIEDGLRRAPEERSKALREILSWFRQG